MSRQDRSAVPTAYVRALTTEPVACLTCADARTPENPLLVRALGWELLRRCGQNSNKVIYFPFHSLKPSQAQEALIRSVDAGAGAGAGSGAPTFHAACCSWQRRENRSTWPPKWLYQRESWSEAQLTRATALSNTLCTSNAETKYTRTSRPREASKTGPQRRSIELIVHHPRRTADGNACVDERQSQDEDNDSEASNDSQDYKRARLT